AVDSLRFIADERTNRVIVVCKKELFPQVKGMIEQLDQSVDFEKPLQRSLKYARATEVLPVLAKLIAESKEDLDEIAKNGVQAKEAESLTKESDGGSDDMPAGGTGNGGSSGMANTKDRLRDPDEALPPECLIVGKTRLIADSAANTIVVIGPPESRNKASSI